MVRGDDVMRFGARCLSAAVVTAALVAGFGAMAQQPGSAAAPVAAGIELDREGRGERTIERFFAVYNSGDADRMLAFYEQSATEEFRGRRSNDEDRALYRRLFGDTGPLEIRAVRREAPERVTVEATSRRIPEPVSFTFTLQGGRIHGFAVNIGGPGERDAGLPPLDIPAGADRAAVARAIEGYLQRLAGDGVLSGVVLVARGGEPLVHRAFGLAERGAGRANATTTRFDVGSITKLLTKVAVGQLLRDGKLRLTDTILDHLPDYPDADIARKITVEQLLEHRSGLGDIFNERWESTAKDRLVTPRSFFPLFAGRPLQFEPGTGRGYSNAGYIVLGAIVEAASGMPYADYVEQRVFAPAGMKRSGFLPRDGSVDDLATGYTRQGAGGGGDPRPNSGLLPLRGCPAGSSSHTAADLLRFDRALRGGKLLGAGWTEWAFSGAAPAGSSAAKFVDSPLGVAVGGPGVNAVLESDGETTVVVLTNTDPPLAEELGLMLFRGVSAS